MGADVNKGEAFTKLFTAALDGDKDAGGLVSIPFISGETVMGVQTGYPMVLRGQNSTFSIANFMRMNIMAAFGALAAGNEALRAEDVKIDKLYVNIESGNTTGTSKFSIPAGQELTVDILDGNGTSVEVAGAFTVLETANSFTVNAAASGKYVVSVSVSDASQTTLDSAYANNESVYISTGTVTDVSVPEGKTLVIGTNATLNESSVITTAPQSTVIIDSSNKTFTVKKTGSGETITRITCGGRRIKGWFVQHEDLAEGKTLQIDTK